MHKGLIRKMKEKILLKQINGPYGRSDTTELRYNGKTNVLRKSKLKIHSW